MIAALLRFELTYYARQASVRLAAVVAALLGLAMAPLPAGGERILANGAWAVTFKLGLLSLGSIFIATLFCGHALLRDRDARMEAIVFSTPVTPFQYLASRFLGLAGASMAVYLIAVLGLAMGQLLPLRGIGAMGPAVALPHLWAALTLGLPNTLLCAAVLFTVTALSPKPMVTYTAGISLYIFYFVGSMVGNSPMMAQAAYVASESLGLATLLDPFGMVGMMTQARHWTPAEKNTQLLSLSGGILSNRLMWLAVASALFAGVYRLFDVRPASRPPTKKATPEPHKAAATGGWAPPLPPSPLTFTAHLRALASQVRIETRVAFSGLSTLVLALLWVGMVSIELHQQLTTGERGLPYHITAGLVVPILAEPLAKLGTFVIVFYAAEVAWGARSAGLAPILDATPTHAAITLPAKLAVLGAVALGLVGLNITVGLAFQLILGGGLAGAQAYGALALNAGLSLVLFSVPALVIAMVAPGKYVGMVLAGVLPVALRFFNRATGLDDTLVGRWFLPTFHYSDMAGALSTPATLAFAAMWGALGLGLALVASAKLKQRVSGGKGRTHPGRTWLAAGLCALAAAAGGWVIAGEVSRPDWNRIGGGAPAWAAQYEATYAHLAGEPAPQPTAVDLAVDLYPDERRYTAQGTLTFEHRGEAPLSDVWVGLPLQNRRVGEVSIPGARLTASDEALGMYHFVFDVPLEPGEPRQLSFTLDATRSPFAKRNPEAYVLPEATYVELDKFIPFFGYAAHYEIDDARERARYGLPPAQKAPPLKRGEHRAPPRIGFAATVSTAQGQIPLTLGRPMRTWAEAGRVFTRFEAPKPMPASIAVASASWARATDMHRGIEINILYHPEHGYNVDEMLTSTKVALDDLARRFGPYPYDALTIAEIPTFSEAFGATAYPGVIFGVERRFFLVDQRAEDAPNLVRAGVAHELSHMWWGQQLSPANMEGARLLTEGLAVYSEMVVDEQGNDRAYTQKKVAQTSDLYFYFRSYGASVERPLARVTEQPFVYYFKGPHVAWALRETLGEDRIDAALRELLANEGHPHAADSYDLLDRLLAGATPNEARMVKELLTEIVTYELGCQAASAAEAPGGMYEIKASLRARRYAQSESGEAQPAPFTAPVEVALLDGDGQPIGGIRQVDIGSDIEGYTFQAAQRPAAVVIDPRALLLEATRGDNRCALTAEGR